MGLKTGFDDVADTFNLAEWMRSEEDIAAQNNGSEAVRNRDIDGAHQFDKAFFDPNTQNDQRLLLQQSNVDEESNSRERVIEILQQTGQKAIDSLQYINEDQLQESIQKQLMERLERRRHCRDREEARKLDSEIQTLSKANEHLENGDRAGAEQILEAKPEVAAAVVEDAKAATQTSFADTLDGKTPQAQVASAEPAAGVAPTVQQVIAPTLRLG